MADKFCTQCGQRIGLEDRFCIYCGAPAAGPKADSGSSSSRTGTTPRARKTAPSPPHMRGTSEDAGFPEDDQDESEDDEEEEDDQDDEEDEEDQDDEEDEEEPYVITEHDLNYIIACSTEKAPLDSNVLLIRKKKSGLRWMPASLIVGPEDPHVIAAARVYYSIGRKESVDFCMMEMDRDELSDEASNAIFDASDETEIEVFLVFEPMRHDDLDNEIPGKWVMVLNERGEINLKTIIHLPIQGDVLKQKLQKHESFLKDLIQELGRTRAVVPMATDEMVAEFETILANLRIALELISDGVIDHAYCVCHPGKNANIKLYDEISEKGGRTKSALRVPSAVRAAKVLRERNAQLSKHRPARSTIVRRGGNPLPGHSESHTGQDALSRIKKLFRPDS